MPLYETQCRKCGGRDTIFRRVEARDSLPECSRCEGELQRILSAPMLTLEISPYESPATGKWITSRSERREDLRRSGSLEWEPGIREQIAANRAAKDDEAFRPIENAVDSVVAGMVAARKLETL